MAQSQRDDPHAKAQVDFQGTVPFPGIWVEGFSAGLSAPEGSGGRNQAARNSGVNISANTYAYTAWFNTFSAFIPPWAHDGGDAKLIERLKDPTIRARIRKELITPGEGWDNEWQEIPSPEAI